MEQEQKHKIVSFKTYFIILLALITLTGTSVLVTHIDTGKIGVLIAIIIACLKSSLVLAFFMHLIYDKKVYAMFIGLVIFVIASVLIFTFLDYSFR